jgi:hypothetical protein
VRYRTLCTLADTRRLTSGCDCRARARHPREALQLKLRCVMPDDSGNRQPRPGQASSAPKLDCVGGPLDGQQIVDRGEMFLPVARATPPPAQGGTPSVPQPPVGNGAYVKRNRRYIWEPR